MPSLKPLTKSLTLYRSKRVLLILLVVLLSSAPLLAAGAETTSLSDFDLQLDAQGSYLIGNSLTTYSKWNVLDADGVPYRSTTLVNNYANYCSDFVPTLGRSTFYCLNLNLFSYNGLTSIAFYDSTQTFISGVAYDSALISDAYAIPSNASYLRFSTLGGKNSSDTAATARSRYSVMLTDTPVVDLPHDTPASTLFFRDFSLSQTGNTVRTTSYITSCTISYFTLTFDGDIDFIQQLAFDCLMQYDGGTDFVDFDDLSVTVTPFSVSGGTTTYLPSFECPYDGSVHVNIVSSASTPVSGLVMTTVYPIPQLSNFLWSFSNWVVNDEDTIVSVSTERSVGNLEQADRDLESLAQDLNVPKPDISSVMNDIDDNLSVIDSSTVNGVSQLFPSDSLFSTMIVLVFTFALLSFVLFGKKGDNGG